MTEQTKAEYLASNLELIHKGTWCNKIEMDAAAELRRLDANEAALLEALNASANYIDTLGGVSKSYRALITRIEAERN